MSFDVTGQSGINDNPRVERNNMHETITIECNNSFDDILSLREGWDEFIESQECEIFWTFDWCRIWCKYYNKCLTLALSTSST